MQAIQWKNADFVVIAAIQRLGLIVDIVSTYMHSRSRSEGSGFAFGSGPRPRSLMMSHLLLDLFYLL